MEKVQDIIAQLAHEHYTEPRLQLFDVKAASFTENTIVLSGSVLQEENLSHLCREIRKIFPLAAINCTQVKILHTKETPVMQVRMNLTSMHEAKSFLSELTTQLLFGDRVEILEDDGDWVLGRSLTDGYISYTYKSYLGSLDLPASTHIVKEAAVPVMDQPDGGHILTRVFSGTKTAVLTEQGDMVRISASQDGWVPRNTLRAFSELPQDAESLRTLVCQNALSLIGVPYLWGGSSSNGIDCSGLAQWAYRLAGVDLQRDAHMQLNESRRVEPPYLPGDLVFYGERLPDRISVTHVSISLGGWTVIHSSRSRNGVYVDDVQQVPHLRDTWLCGCRIL